MNVQALEEDEMETIFGSVIICEIRIFKSKRKHDNTNIHRKKINLIDEINQFVLPIRVRIENNNNISKTLIFKTKSVNL